MCSDRNSRCSPAGAGPSKNRASPIGALLREARERRPALPVGAQERRSSDRHRGRRERWPLLPVRAQERRAVLPVGPFRPASRPQAAKLPLSSTLIAWTRAGTVPRNQTASPPGSETPVASPRLARQKPWKRWPALPVGAQERRSSDRHRGRRPRNSRSRPRVLRGPGRGRCHATKRPPRRGAKLPSPVPAWRRKPWERWPALPVGAQERRSSDRHRGRRPRNSRSRPRSLRGPGRGRCHATKRPPRRGAKLPSPVPAWRRKPWERWPVLPVGAQERRSSDRHRGRRPRNSRSRPRSLRGPGRGRCHATKRPPHRGAKLPSPVPAWRSRNPGNAGQSPVPAWRRKPWERWPALPVGGSAGLQTGIAAIGRETPALVHAHCVDPGGDGATPPNGLPTGERNSRRQSPPGAETLGTLATPPGGGPGAPVFRPASRP